MSAKGPKIRGGKRKASDALSDAEVHNKENRAEGLVDVARAKLLMSLRGEEGVLKMANDLSYEERQLILKAFESDPEKFFANLADYSFLSNRIEESLIGYAIGKKAYGPQIALKHLEEIIEKPYIENIMTLLATAIPIPVRENYSRYSDRPWAKKIFDLAKEKLNPREQLHDKLNDPNYLPAYAEIKAAGFNRDFSSEENRKGNMGWIMGYGVPSDTSILPDFCQRRKKPIYEFLNVEYINELSDYLIERISEVVKKKEGTVTVLEIGAGDGRLTHFIKEKVEAALPGKVRVIATDNSSWENHGIRQDFPVENMDYREALKVFKPDIVLSSWMPNDADFSKPIRKTPSVKEYVLIGEADSGCCGDPWLTWGYTSDGPTTKKILPYKNDHFERVDVECPHQVGRTQYKFGGESYSQTVSFRRQS
jgi:hypothetical protein